mmetsp:Transcript_75937/g.123341  ORF Transcript_75937/g.123341 Transcript_75937/m.123341 type:complete len:295 (+) Transcript_75937:78-962(+)
MGLDNWTCGACQNVNFGHRNTCNMRSCGRPRDEGGGGPTQFRDPYGGGGGGGGGNFNPMGYQSNGPLGPNSLAGFPPPMPPVPQATLGGQMHAVLGGQMAGDPSNPEFLQMLGAAVLASGMAAPVLGAAGMNFPQYGAVPPPAPPPVQTRYHPYGEGGGGFGKSQYKSRDGGGGIPLVQVPGYALVSDSNSGQKRHQKEEDDWFCTSCGNKNFSFRDKCNMRTCGASRFADPNDPWKCICGNLNFSTRSFCNMRKCKAPKPGTGVDPAAAAANAAADKSSAPHHPTVASSTDGK